MDPRFVAIEQDKVFRADATGALQKTERTAAVQTNPNFDAPWNKIFKVVFFPDRI